MFYTKGEEKSDSIIKGIPNSGKRKRGSEWLITKGVERKRENAIEYEIFTQLPASGELVR